VRRIPRFVLLGLVLALTPMLVEAAPGTGGTTTPGDTGNASPPLLRWDLLRSTIYKPPTAVIWPKGLESYDGKKVRLEGYLMPRFNYQDPEDLLLSGLHPRSIFCGPTDMTALVEVTYPGYQPTEWPELPVEITGTFHLSQSPRNLFYLYHVFVDSMRVLRIWEQDFPGAVDELQQAEDEGR
jgi:hypothetical protein